MKIIDEFKTFISRGNVVDMAVGIIVGTAFTKIVNSLVADVITPAISCITGKINLADAAVVINEDLSINYGSFIQSVIDFLIISLVVFIMVKCINTFKAKYEKPKEEEVLEEPKPSNEEVLLAEIRDLIKKTNDIQ
ncbi:MAG: large-conductance mechanosensitive channel protein MscL [Clostridia bacterium]|nr:large-conductance mechanosensitive channel protein MscL [Clostridia bacterium]